MDISILLPTRGRTVALESSIKSLLSTASRPQNTEILLAWDIDDEKSYEYFTKNIVGIIDQYQSHYTCFGFERLGYIRLNEYVNYLAGQSQGDWLFFWGDDAVMESMAWDQKITAVRDFRVLRIPTHNQHPYAIFPIVPRAWYELFGYISDHQLTDTWVSQIAYTVDIMQDIDVKVTHDRYDITGNNNDETYANRPMLEGNMSDPRDFNHKSWTVRRLNDAKKIADYLRTQGQDVSWFDMVLQGKQDPWARMCSPECDPNNQVKRLTK